MNLDWVESEHSISLYHKKEIFFEDSNDHFQNAVLRLLDVTPEVFKEFVESVAIRINHSQDTGYLLALQQAWGTLSPLQETLPRFVTQPIWLTPYDDTSKWLTNKVRDDSNFGIVHSPGSRHAWLSNTSTGQVATVEDVVYEQNYFEGGISDVGYGSYLEQAPWRLEKAERQCSEIAGIREMVGLPTENLKILDIGSGYGFFRKACQTKGWSSDGIEISHHAAKVSSELFNLDTYVGSLDEYIHATQARYDIVVMWDFIEHVDNPLGAIQDAVTLLAPQGSLFIRTPNLHAFEFAVFGSDYHSLKREHLNLFSPYSLSKVVRRAGITPHLVLTSSHLLKGFVELDIDSLSVCQRGSDILFHGFMPR